MELKLLSNNDKELFEFELRNRAWFEKLVPPRNPDYFIYERFKKITKLLLQEQNDNKILMFIVYKDCKVVGRVNFTEIENNHAELGYRSCQSISGLGLTTEFVKQAIELVKNDYGIESLNACTTTNNKASINIMEKCGFSYISTDKKAIELNGSWLDFLYYKLN